MVNLGGKSELTGKHEVNPMVNLGGKSGKHEVNPEVNLGGKSELTGQPLQVGAYTVSGNTVTENVIFFLEHFLMTFFYFFNFS